MNSRMRVLAAVLCALVSTVGMASLAFAQEPDDCYPVPVDECEQPNTPDTGVLPDTDVDEEDDAVVPPKPPAAPSGSFGAAGQAPVVLAQTALAQTGMPAAMLLAVIGLTLASGAALLVTTRRRAS